MTERPEGAPDPEVRAYRPARQYTAAIKQRILVEYEQLDRAGKGLCCAGTACTTS